MTSEATYLNLLQKINRGNTQFNNTLDRARAVLILNECKNRWVEKHLKEKDSILIESLQEIIKTEILSFGNDKGEYVEYELKDDFYESILAKCQAQKENCKNTVYSREVKTQNKNINQFDENLKPDFDFEWTFHTIQGNFLKVYKTDFDILSTTFEYYSVIPAFDIEGYEKLDGQQSTNKPFILSDQYVEQIINMAAEEYMRDFNDPNGLQIAKDRTNNQE